MQRFSLLSLLFTWYLSFNDLCRDPINVRLLEEALHRRPTKVFLSLYNITILVHFLPCFPTSFSVVYSTCLMQHELSRANAILPPHLTHKPILHICLVMKLCQPTYHISNISQLTGQVSSLHCSSQKPTSADLLSQQPLHPHQCHVLVQKRNYHGQASVISSYMSSSLVISHDFMVAPRLSLLATPSQFCSGNTISIILSKLLFLQQ